MNLFNLMATMGIDTTDFERGLTEAQQKTAETTKKIKEIGTSNEKVNAGFKKLGTAAKVMGGALAAGFGVGAKFGIELDTTMKKLQTQTGKTDEEMKKIEGSLRNIYKSGAGESIEQVGEAFAYATQVMGGTNEELEKVTKNAFSFSDAFGTDVNLSIETVNGMMETFGISSDEAFNILTQGAQNGANAQGDLLETVREFSPAFEEMGFSASDMVNVLVQGGQEGAFQVNKIADAMNEFTTKATDGNEATQEAFKALGFEAGQVEGAIAKGGETAKSTFLTMVERLAEVDDAVERERLGVALFGTMWEDSGEKAILSLGNTKKVVDENKDAMSGLNTQYDTLGGFITEVKRSFEDWALTVVNQLLPPLRDLKEWISKNKELINTLAGAIMGVVVAIMVYKAVNFVMLLGGMVKAMLAATKTTGLLAAAQTALNGAMMLNPIGLIIGLVIGLVAVFIYLWNTNEGFRQFWIDAWEAIKQSFIWAWEKIKEGWELMKEWFSKLGEALKQYKEWWLENWQSMKDFFAGIWEWIKEKWNNMVQWFVNLGNKLQELKDKWSQRWEEIKQKTREVVDNVVNFFKELPGKLWESFKNAIQKAADWAREMGTKGREAAKSLFEAVMNGLKSLPGQILELGKKIPSMLWEGIKSMTGWLGSKVSGFIDNIIGGRSLSLDVNTSSIGAINSYGGIATSTNARMNNLSNNMSSNMNVSLNIGGREFDRLVIKTVTDNYGKIENIVQSKERGRR